MHTYRKSCGAWALIKNYNSNVALRSFDDVTGAFPIVTFPVSLVVRLRLLSRKGGEEEFTLQSSRFSVRVE